MTTDTKTTALARNMPVLLINVTIINKIIVVLSNFRDGGRHFDKYGIKRNVSLALLDYC